MTGTCDRHNGLRRRTMWLGITSSAALLLFTVSAFADSCIFSAAPPFQLRSDAVDWTMQIASGTSCTRGLKLGPITISDVKLIASPPSGQVVIKGPAVFIYRKTRFSGTGRFHPSSVGHDGQDPRSIGYQGHRLCCGQIAHSHSSASPGDCFAGQQANTTVLYSRPRLRVALRS